MATALDGAGSGDRSSSLSPSLDLVTARQAVGDLLQFRDTYLEGTAHEFGLFDDSPTADGLWTNRTVLKHLLDRVQTQSREKSKSVWHKFTTTVNLLRQLEPGFANGTPQEKSEFCYLNGKAMNAILSSEDDVDYAHLDSSGNNCGVAVGGGDEQGDDGAGSSKQSRNPETLRDRGNLVSTAVQWLTRALKFNPQLTEAWCELGECYWRQGDLSTAQQHFNQALKIDANHAEAMCQLSMLLRHLPAATSLASDEAGAGGGRTEVAPLSTTEVGRTSTTGSPLGESLQLAHAAVQLRPWDGHAWLILGNALLTAFFADPLAPFGLPVPLAGQTDADVKSTSASTKTQLMMSRCLAAYAQAAKQSNSTLLEPNFHFNRGLAYHFQDMFSQCLTSWLRAVCLDPHWPNPRSRAVRLANFLLAVADLDDPRPPGGKQEDEDWEAFTYPMAACLCLKPGDSEPVASQVEHQTATATQRGKKKKPALSDRQLANSLARLLGPYCASVAGHETGQSAAGWATTTTAFERRRKARKAHKKCLPGAEENAQSPGDKASGWRLVYFNELRTGTNQGCLCVGRLVRRLPTDSVLAVNLLLLDALNQPITVRLCNVGEDLGPVDRDILVIPHPYVEEREVDLRLLRAAHTVDSLLSGSRPPAVAESSSLPTHPTEDILLSQLQLEDKRSKQEGEADSLSVLHIRFIRVPLPNLLVVNGQPLSLENRQLEKRLAELQTRLASSQSMASTSTRRLTQLQAEAREVVQSVTSADLLVENLKNELRRKEAQLQAITCRQTVDSAREMQARLLLNELIELKGNVRVVVRCHHDIAMAEEEGAFRFLGDDTLVVVPPLQCPNATTSPTADCGRDLADAYFKVHRVLPPSASQKAVFEEVNQLVTSCIDGYTVAITAFGQTGSGKTFSMLGLPSKPGIIPRAIRQLVSQCQQRAPVWRYRISLAVVQIYKEIIFDLLTDGSGIPENQNDNLLKVNLHDNGKQILLSGCCELDVNTEDAILEEIRKARIRRQASATALNVSPGFLHFIVLLRVRGVCSPPESGQILHECGQQWQSNPDPGLCSASANKSNAFEPKRQASQSSADSTSSLTTMSHGLLVLADLAGFKSWPSTDSNTTCTCSRNRPRYVGPTMVAALSQVNAFNSTQPSTLGEASGTSASLDKTRRNSNNRNESAIDEESDETKYLGRSLINLTRVFDHISASTRCPAQKRAHVPYRESALTHLLKPTLTGDAKFMLIVTVNSQRSCLEASLRSLRLAAKAANATLGRAKLNRNLTRGIRICS